MPGEDRNNSAIQDTSQIVIDDDEIACGPVLIARLEVCFFNHFRSENPVV